MSKGWSGKDKLSQKYGGGEGYILGTVLYPPLKRLGKL